MNVDRNARLIDRWGAEWAEALVIAAEFLGGDFDALRRRPWA